jgi:MYXO-CTERM domain-containing protein
MCRRSDRKHRSSPADAETDNVFFFNLGVDNVSITVGAETPLPASLPLFAGAVGLVALVARRRKQRQAAQLH